MTTTWESPDHSRRHHFIELLCIAFNESYVNVYSQRVRSRLRQDDACGTRSVVLHLGRRRRLCNRVLRCHCNAVFGSFCAAKVTVISHHASYLVQTTCVLEFGWDFSKNFLTNGNIYRCSFVWPKDRGQFHPQVLLSSVKLIEILRVSDRTAMGLISRI